MSEIKNVIICGLGAVGTAFAVKILNTKPETLKILVDEERLTRYKKHPRCFNGKILDFQYLLPDERNYKADLILISVKYKALEEAIYNIKNFVKSDTIILSLLNGVTSEEKIAQSYGWDKLLLSYFIGHSAMREKDNIIHDGVATIVYGAKKPTSNALNNIERVKQYLNSVNIDYKIPDNMSRALWLKFMLNTACNQLSAVLGMTFGEMLVNNEFMNLAKDVMKEVELCAKAEGITSPETMIEETIKHMQTMIPEGKTSMLQDVEAGRETEVENFAGTIIALGEKHNIPTPYNKILKQMIDTIYSKAHPERYLEKEYQTLP